MLEYSSLEGCDSVCQIAGFQTAELQDLGTISPSLDLDHIRDHFAHTHDRDPYGRDHRGPFLAKEMDCEWVEDPGFGAVTGLTCERVLVHPWRAINR